MHENALVASSLSVEFSGLHALDGVTLSLQGGQILGLIGPNGSGKTTLVNAITGQVPLASGHVRLAGNDITGRLPHQVSRAGVARTFQVGRHFGNLSVVENVTAAALSHGTGMRSARTLALGLLEEFGLMEQADALVRELRHGDKRRVEVARALAGNPAFLLLDEPAAGMDDAETESLLAVLAGLPVARGLGILIIDHDMGLIMRLCHQLHVLASGRTIAEGDVGAVTNDPAVINAYLGQGAADA